MNETRSKAVKPKIHKNTICPFSSLLCDDLTIENHNNQLNVTSDCSARSKRGFTKTTATTSYRVHGKEVELEEALAAAAKIIKRSSIPLFTGLGTDVDGTRAVLALADKKGAYVDHMGSKDALKNYRVLQDRGYMLTTLTEVKNRADLIIMAGTDAVSQGYERFFERFVWNEHSMFDLKTSEREIIYIGDKLKTKAGISPTGKKPTHIKCEQNQIGEVIGILNAILAGQEFTEKRINGVSITQLNELKEKITSASYGVVVWSPTALDFEHAELTIESLCNFVRDRNVEQRFGGLSLGGNNGGITANNVAAWQSGYPLPIRFTKGYPEFDPNNFDTESLLANSEVDSLTWISSFGADTPPPKTKLPTIVLADSQSKIEKEPDVFISVGTPGLDHGGQMIRTDNVVSMTLSSVRKSELLSVSNILKQIHELV